MIFPPFETYPQLRSSRILLREVVPGDAENAFGVVYFQNVPAKDLDEAREMLRKIRERYDSGDSVHFGIEDVATGNFIGTVGFYRGFANETAEVGYIMKEEFRRCGYMTEAVALIVDFGFNVMKLKKIFANTAPENMASHGVLRKNGFVESHLTEEGRLQFQLVRSVS